ncbi:heme ABC transporter ATP-binding protein [Rhodopila sp.]|jgi:iron complex transport system ATP-binding protein|uniref:heme ABC transporter ATP-binding protein n=1 Tax=Rhodopila sp. TaxID=2480087 RepID=UPI002B9DD41F|nr:heme ABC transporter ATP-binding protein [Rhodopila sp.]HVZ08061.1 heme ABC transporter ATP-binding protein [Rhodopila sp.]
MLEARSVTLRRGGRTILDDVSVVLRAGEVTGVIGPNGSGKSTLLRILSGVTAPDAGEVFIAGTPLRRLRPAELALRRAVLSQERPAGFAFTVRELVSLGAQRGIPRAAAETQALVTRAIDRVGLGAAEHQATDRLSGGERQRAHLARALVQLWTGRGVANGGGMLLLDEPLSAQDPLHQIDILDLAREHAGQGGTVMIILHDINAAVRAADRLVVLRQGHVAADGSPTSVVTKAMLAGVFDVDLTPCTAPEPPLPFVLPQVARRIDPHPHSSCPHSP